MIINKLGGNFASNAREAFDNLRDYDHQLIESAFSEFSPDATLVDCHLHMLGLTGDGSGCSVAPHMLTWRHPLERIKYMIFRSAAGIKDESQAAKDYIKRYRTLSSILPRKCKALLLAFAPNYNNDKTQNLSRSEFIVPNESVTKITFNDGDTIPAWSIHPEAPDAMAQLADAIHQGIKFIKWLPNSMNIDPANESYRPFYELMSAGGITLLTHTGHEAAVNSAECQELGNPLRLRLPLSCGVRTIMAHCASSGSSQDLDRGSRDQTNNFDLFARMMDTDEYKEILYADISATMQVNRFKIGLGELLKRQDWHSRLINGSDYPLPAINCLFNVSKLQQAGFLASENVEPLRRIYNCNPLLFDFMLKLLVVDPESWYGFDPKIFTYQRLLGEC